MKIFVKTKPNSKEGKIEKISENSFIVWIKEPPRKGLANEAVIKVLAKYFDTNLSKIKLISGFRSREKIFEIF
jgi:hypothetical protein